MKHAKKPGPAFVAVYFKEFISGYIAAALWSTTDNSRDDGGDPLDDNYDSGDLSSELNERIIQDCGAFLGHYSDTIDAAECKRNSGMSKYEQAGHDFWLTRNGHGCGFWDGDWSEPHAATLTAASEAFRGVDLYVGNDGKVDGGFG